MVTGSHLSRTAEQGAAPLTKNRRSVQPAETAFLDRATLRGMALESDEDLGTVGGASAMRGCDDPPPPLLREGIAQFNRGEYFEQHETLEVLWRGGPPGGGPPF